MITLARDSRVRLLSLAACACLAILLVACDGGQPARPHIPDPILEPIFTSTPVICPAEPPSLTLDVATPAESAAISGRLLIDDRDPKNFNCQIEAGGQCRLVDLPLVSAGAYNLIIELPDTSRMKITHNRVEYLYQPFQFALAQGSRQEQFTEQAVESLTMRFPVRLDESNCLVVDFREIDYTTQAATGPETEIRLTSGLLMTDLGSEVCRQQPVDTPVSTEVTLAAGTDLAGVQVIYEVAGRGRTADCQVREDTYTCTAVIPNPIISQSLAIRAIVDGEVYTGFQMPFDNLCFYFGD